MDRLQSMGLQELETTEHLILSLTYFLLTEPKYSQNGHSRDKQEKMKASAESSNNSFSVTPLENIRASIQVMLSPPPVRVKSASFKGIK